MKGVEHVGEEGRRVEDTEGTEQAQRKLTQKETVQERDEILS